MNAKCPILTGLLTLLITFSGISQETIEKKYYDPEKQLGGDITLKSSVIKVEGSKTHKIFQFESPDNGNYYLNIWLMGGELENFGSGKFTQYELSVNNEKQTEKLKSEKNNWHNVGYKDGKSKEKKSVKLKKGLNQIVFSCNAPEIPAIEFIRLSKDKSKSEISEDSYNQFVAEIENEVQDRIKNPKPEKDSLAVFLKSGVVLSNPEGNYYHHKGVSFKYTTYKTFSFNSGQQVFFTTYASDRYYHVLEVFSSSNPEAYTWVDVSNSSGLASLNISIPATGTYYVRVRAYHLETQGLVDLNVNGQYYYSDCAVSGSGFAHTHETPTTYNYFTCKLSGDSRIWIEDRSGVPGKIRAYNDDYYGYSDFHWDLESRVTKDFSVRIGAVLISSYGSYDPTGTCDLYMKCENSNIMSYFPNLKADDAIQSAPESRTYNCISWSGGITNYWEWPSDHLSEYFVPLIDKNGVEQIDEDGTPIGDPLPSFDKFYEAQRYADAMTYTRTDATSSNSWVDLWYNPHYGEYTHASVSEYANNHPHGYDWESKPGRLMRTFHPRNSLRNEPRGYGNVNNYYKPTSLSKSAMLLDESISRGLSVIENVELTANEIDVISKSIDQLSVRQKSNLESKYEAWKKTWNNLDIAIHSNPRMYAKSKEYEDFIEYCEAMGVDSWPFVFDKFEQGDFFVINALKDLTLADNMDVLKKVKGESKLKSTTASGATIVRSPQTYAMKYIKELLKSTGAVTSSEDDGIVYSNSFDFCVYPNPMNATSQIIFNLPYDAKVSVEVFDLTGRVLSVPQKNQFLRQGDYNYQLNIPENFKGTCLVKLRINNNDNVQLLIVE